jgi:hypothetical protein
MSTEEYNFSDWDNEIDVNAVSMSVMKAQANTGTFEKVPYGTYIVGVDDITLGLSKKGQKQMVVDFVIVDEDSPQQGKTIKAFFSVEYRDPNGDKVKERQVLGLRIHAAQEFLRSMKTTVDIPNGFHGYGQLNTKIQAIKADIEKNGWEYQLRYAKENNYDTYAIEAQFEKADQNDNNPF